MSTTSTPSVWKRVLPLAAWLWIFPPVGLWKLYTDPVLSPSAKWRILLYSCVLPLLAYLAFSLWGVNAALEKILP